MAKRTILQERAAELIDQHGSTRAAGRVLRLSGPYLYRLMTGEATEPTDPVLRKLKLRRVVTYERTDSVALSQQSQENSDGRSIGGGDRQQLAAHGAVGDSAVLGRADSRAVGLGGDVPLGQLAEPSPRTEVAQKVTLTPTGGVSAVDQQTFSSPDADGAARG